jgi:hypothetical protein
MYIGENYRKGTREGELTHGYGGFKFKSLEYQRDKN